MFWAAWTLIMQWPSPLDSFSLYFFLLYLIQLANYCREVYGPLELTIYKKPCKEKWVVESADILEDSNHWIDLSLIYIVFLVHAEALFQVAVGAWPVVDVRGEVLTARALVEVFLFLGVEKPEVVIVQVQVHFLEKGWVDYRSRGV